MQREVDVAAAAGLDQLRRDQAQPVLASVVDIDVEALLDEAFFDGLSSWAMANNKLCALM